jgi:anaerobic magnesium-protoporphyrin IX monomethyl ester cyclase
VDAMETELLLISIASNSHRNIGCLSLYASAVSAGISTNLLFIPREAEYSDGAFSKYLKANNYKIIGISLTTRDFYFARTITSHIRKYLPESHIVWGGIHPTSNPEECLPFADSICIGEGELFLINLINSLRAGADISHIPGIGVKSDIGNKLILNTPDLIHDLNSLPFPRFDFEHFYVLDGIGLHFFGPRDYVEYSRHNGDGYVLLSSRSCPHRCSYCINSFLNRLYEGNSFRLYRRRSVDNILKEITYALASIPGIGFINFMDDHFLTNNQWIDEFCEKYKNQIHLPFIIRATPNTIRDEIISLLKDAGLSTVQMGIQSGSEITHKLIFHRSFNKEDVLRAAKVLNKHGLVCLYDFIIDNDFETDKERNETIELMLRLPKPYIANLFAMAVFPKTDLEDMYKERNMTPRIDPYASNYFNFKDNDFYFQLASLIPHIDEVDARRIFKNRDDQKTLEHLRKLFLEKVPPVS